MRYFIELTYNGTDYHGWQIQPNASSVQEELNKAFSVLLKEEINVVGAGRTDTGVHARFYVAHMDCGNEIGNAADLIYKMNRITGKGIAIRKIYPVATDMHARFSAQSRTYKYFIGKEKDPFGDNFRFRTYPLPDIGKMNEACKILFEYEDFTSFSKVHTDTKTNNCRIMEARWVESEDELIFTITADRFLRNMVRAIVGTMLEIGQLKITPEDLRRIIESRDRGNAGTSVPGNALFLWDIKYNI